MEILKELPKRKNRYAVLADMWKYNVITCD